MIKSELIAALAACFPQLLARDVESVVKELLDAMRASLARGDRIEIRGFGSFAVNYRPPRTGRNPKTGERVAVPGKYTPHFRAGKALRNRVEAADWPLSRQEGDSPECQLFLGGDSNGSRLSGL